MLNRKDLVLIKYDEGISKLFNKIHKEVLKRIALEWFKVPEIRPSGSTAKLEYEDITKAALVQRITNYDWVNYLIDQKQQLYSSLTVSDFISLKVYMLIKLLSSNVKVNLQQTDRFKIYSDLIVVIIDLAFSSFIKSVKLMTLHNSE